MLEKKKIAVLTATLRYIFETLWRREQRKVLAGKRQSLEIIQSLTWQSSEWHAGRTRVGKAAPPTAGVLLALPVRHMYQRFMKIEYRLNYTQGTYELGSESGVGNIFFSLFFYRGKKHLKSYHLNLFLRVPFSSVKRLHLVSEQISGTFSSCKSGSAAIGQGSFPP